MMDRHPQTSSSQLSSASSTSSLPSLSGSIAESDYAQPEVPSLQSQESTTASTASERVAETKTMGATSADGISTTSRLQQRPTIPFKSFRSLKSTGPFHPLAAFITLTSAVAVATAAAASSSTTQHRRLEDNNEDGNEWTGEWNGEWQATDDADYENNWGDDQAASSSSSSGMWLNDPDPDAWSPEQIITFVSIGILSFMTLLCCVCYPEILVVGFTKMCGCCRLGGGAAKDGAGAGVDENMGADYVGGAQDGKRKKKRRNSKTRRERSSSRNSSGRDVELV